MCTNVYRWKMMPVETSSGMWGGEAKIDVVGSEFNYDVL
jgi:hypothetical protein